MLRTERGLLVAIGCLPKDLQSKFKKVKNKYFMEQITKFMNNGKYNVEIIASFACSKTQPQISSSYCAHIFSCPIFIELLTNSQH